jgi:hypothetical protein
MRAIVAATGFCLIGLVSVAARGEKTPEAGKPVKTQNYAMVAAVGEQFTIMTEVRNTGSHISPYRGESFNVKDNFLNLAVLRSLDKAMAERDPDSKRIYMALPSAKMDAAEKWEREDVALSEVEASLKAAPERAQWDRIIVVTPSYHPYQANGLGGRLVGFGIFYQPNCRRPGCRSNDSFYSTTAGVTPDDTPIRLQQFVAPYAFLDIWVLDAKTFAVIDRQRTYDSIKVFNPQSTSFHIYDNVSAEDQSKYVFRTLETSVEKAVAHSEVLKQGGIVNVGDIREIKADGASR